MAASGQDSTPYVDALLAYAELDPGRYQVPGHKGGAGADPAMRELVGDTGLRNDVPSVTEGTSLRSPVSPTSSRLAGSAPPPPVCPGT